MKYLGADKLPGFERGGAAVFGVVEPASRTKALLHDLRGAVYAEFADVRIRAKPGLLIVFRVLQGIGGGGLAPVEQRPRRWEVSFSTS
jgi:MFS family permease